MRNLTLSTLRHCRISLFCLALVSSASAQQIAEFQWTTENASVHEKAEATFHIDATYDNPYDPDEVAVDALISGPSGESYEMPCFWYQPVTWQAVEFGEFANFNPPGAGIWMLRFAPESAGEWTVSIRVVEPNRNSTSDSHLLDVQPSPAKGFIRLDPNDRQGLRFDSGEPFLPLGINLAWNESHSLTPFYQLFMTPMAENGMNWMRHWFTPFARQALEWSSSHWSNIYHGVGRYSQEAAAVTDMVLELAREKEIYVQIAIEQHGKYSARVDPMWGENPYNADVPGGWLELEADFFSDPDAIAAIKKKYRYIVARWGYSRNVFAWELFNEANWIDVPDSVIGEWHKIMSTHLKQLDPYDHLVTTSTTREELEEFADHPDMDILQEHIYGNNIDNQVATLDDEMLEAFDKQVLVGEYGAGLDYGSFADPAHPDLWGDHVRQTTWIGTMKRVPNMFWFWKEYIHPYDLYPLFQPVSQFWAGEDPGAQSDLGIADFALSGSDAAAQLKLHGLKSSQAAYAYLYDESYGSWAESGPTISGLKATLPNVSPGVYDLVIVKPSAGAQLPVQRIEFSTTTDYEVALPDFSKDIAFKLVAPGRRYADWEVEHFTAQEILDGLSAPSATPAGDGVPNLLKFALGIADPKSAARLEKLPQLVRLDDDSLAYEFATPGGDLVYQIQRSTNLADWQVVEEIRSPDADTRVFKLSPPSVGEADFLKLRVSKLAGN